LLEISADEKVRTIPLNSSDWQQRTVLASIDQSAFQVGVEPHMPTVYFVRRADLDKWYPDPAKPAAHQPDDTPSKPTTSKRKPGPKIRHDWRLHVAAEVHRLKESGKGTPTASQLAQFCYDKWEWQPDESEIQKLLKFLVNE
jgi:hypothetical protein